MQDSHVSLLRFTKYFRAKARRGLPCSRILPRCAHSAWCGQRRHVRALNRVSTIHSERTFPRASMQEHCQRTTPAPQCQRKKGAALIAFGKLLPSPGLSVCVTVCTTTPMHACIHTYIHTSYIHTSYIHTYIHAYIQVV